MKIAVLAWGSLVWRLGDLKIITGFVQNGLSLPVEFCRVSGRHDQPKRLTLVIDENIGTYCPIYSAISSFENLADAKENLRIREGIDHINGIGFVDLVSGTESHRAKERHPRAVEAIKSWSILNSYDSTIWTALASNFNEPLKAGEPFSVDAAIRYLEARDQTELNTTLDYIRRAPLSVQTPVRAAVNKRWPM